LFVNRLWKNYLLYLGKVGVVHGAFVFIEYLLAKRSIKCKNPLLVNTAKGVDVPISSKVL
jgi:hypothetical protein